MGWGGEGRWDGTEIGSVMGEGQQSRASTHGNSPHGNSPHSNSPRGNSLHGNVGRGKTLSAVLLCDTHLGGIEDKFYHVVEEVPLLVAVGQPH